MTPVESPWARWTVELDSGIPAYRQIINHVSVALATGQLKRGDRLPTIRVLHAQLGLNPNTVAKAYRELELKGVIVSQRGTGCFIKEGPPVSRLTPAERRHRLEGLYRRLLAEAAGCGVAQDDLLAYLNQRITRECTV